MTDLEPEAPPAKLQQIPAQRTCEIGMFVFCCKVWGRICYIAMTSTSIPWEFWLYRLSSGGMAGCCAAFTLTVTASSWICLHDVCGSAYPHSHYEGKRFLSPHTSLALVFSDVSVLTHVSDGCKTVSHELLICVFLSSSDVEHLFNVFLSFLVSSVLTGMFVSFVRFLFWGRLSFSYWFIDTFIFWRLIFGQ